MATALRVSYWTLAVLLTGFGLVAIPSIGMPFLATGVALLVLSPFRHRRPVFWPWLAGVIAFFVGSVLVAPLACFAQETAAPPSGQDSSAVEVGGGVGCSNVLGIDYAGGPGYEPPLWPAAAAGAATALGAGLATRIVLSGRSNAGGRDEVTARD